jgi:hypothetical protein
VQIESVSGCPVAFFTPTTSQPIHPPQQSQQQQHLADDDFVDSSAEMTPRSSSNQRPDRPR